MNFDLQNCNQFSRWIDQAAFYPIYSNLDSLSRIHTLNGFALGVAWTDALYSSIQTIGSLVEMILKGLANLLGSAVFNSKCNAYRGFLQITLGTCSLGLIALPVIAIRTSRVAIQFFFDPTYLTSRESNTYKNKIDNVLL